MMDNFRLMDRQRYQERNLEFGIEKSRGNKRLVKVRFNPYGLEIDKEGIITECLFLRYVDVSKLLRCLFTLR